MTQPTFRDVELLSAYLDGQLSQADSARLQARIAADPELEALLRDLSQSRALLRRLPRRRSPRNFTLSPQKAGIRPPLPRAYPVLRLASGLAFALFLFVFVANFLTAPSAQQSLAVAQAPADTTGVGGGLAPAASPAPTEARPFSGGGGPEETPTPSPELGFARVPTQPPAAETPATKAAAPVSVPVWQVALLGLGLVLAGSAFFIRWRVDRAFFRKIGRR